MGDKQFNSVYDSPLTTRTDLSPIQFDIMEESASASMIHQPQQYDINFQMLGLEKATDHELIVFYQALVPGEPAIKLQPGRISHEVLKGTGILTCERLRCTSRLVLPCAFIRRGWRLVDQDDTKTWIGSRTGHICLIWPYLEDPARCVAIQASLSVRIVLRRSECISCCTVSLVRESPVKGHKELLHVL